MHLFHPSLPHFLAVFDKDVPEVRRLLADPVVDALETMPGDVTALHVSALANCAEAVPLLVAVGVAVDAPIGLDGSQVFSTSSAVRQHSSGLFHALIACRGGTALGCPSCLLNPAVVAALLQAGASCGARDAAGYTPLGRVPICPVDLYSDAHIWVVERLLAAGADPLLPLTLRNQKTLLNDQHTAGLAMPHLMRQHQSSQRQVDAG